MVVDDEPRAVAFFEYERGVALVLGGVAFHFGDVIPLIGSPGVVTLDDDEGIFAVDLLLLHAGASFLVRVEVAGPADDGGLKGAADDDDVVGDVFVEEFDVADLPGGEHFADGHVNLLIFGKLGDEGFVLGGFVGFLFGVFFLGGGGGRDEGGREKEGEECGESFFRGKHGGPPAEQEYHLSWRMLGLRRWQVRFS